MAGKSASWANALLLLLFNNSVSGVGSIGSGLQASVTAGSLYVSLHTADPGSAGTQATSEITYTSYARVAVARSSGGWTVTTNSVSPTSAITFPAGTGGTGTATFFGLGVASSGATQLLYSGAITPNIVCGNGITPQLTTASAITES